GSGAASRPSWSRSPTRSCTSSSRSRPEMAAVETLVPASRLPGPPELLPGRPDAIVDLQSDEGVGLVGGRWRYADARVDEVEFVELGSPEDPLGPGTIPNRTYDVVPAPHSPPL